MLKTAIAIVLLTAVAVPTVLLATQTQQGPEARVTAYKHADGRIEFAIQIKEGNEWGTRILPRGRFLNDDSRTERWLASTPVTLPAGYPIVPLPILNPGPDIIAELYPNVTYSAGEWSDAGHIKTELTVQATTANDQRITEGELLYSCFGGPLYDDDGFRGYEYTFGGSLSITGVEAADNRTVVVRAEGVGEWSGERFEREWEFSEWDELDLFNIEFMSALKGYSDVSITFFDNFGREITVGFPISGAFITPVQPNLDFCGQYDY